MEFRISLLQSMYIVGNCANMAIRVGTRRVTDMNRTVICNQSVSKKYSDCEVSRAEKHLKKRLESLAKLAFNNCLSK